MILLTIEAGTLTRVILNFVRTGEFFKPELNFALKVILIMIAGLYTYTLTIGAWKKWEQYLIVPLPFAIGIIVALFGPSPLYATIIGLVSALLIANEIHIATQLKNNLIKFKPYLVLRQSAKRITVVFSLIGAVLVLATPFHKENSTKLVDRVQQLLVTETSEFVDKNLSNPADVAVILNTVGIETDQTTLNLILGNEGSLDFGATVEKTLTAELDKLLEPYQQFVAPLMAVIAYGVFQLLGFASLVIYYSTLGILFWMAKKTGFIKIANLPVVSEVPTFEEPVAYNETEELR